MATKQRKVTFLLSESEHEKIKKDATRAHKSFSNFVRSKLNLPELKAGAPTGKRDAKKKQT
jgi:hypothetical protein